MSQECRNWRDVLKGEGPTDCMREADPKYTMDFTDVEAGAYIYWCSCCGPLETALGEAFEGFVNASPENAQRAAAAIDQEKSKERS